MLGLGLSIPQLATRGGRTLTLSQQVAALFANGAQGAWYDPSDYTTLFEDAAGTTPVTAMEQPVGLILDKSKGLVLGAEEVINGDNEAALFSTATGPSGERGTVTRSTDLGVAAAKFTANASGATYIHPYAGTMVPAGKAIRVSYRVYIPTAWTGAGIKPVDAVDGSLSVAAVATRDQWVSVSFIRPAKSSPWLLGIGDPNTVDHTGQSFYIDDLSIRELPGNHAYQSTTTSRPTLSARVNQYLNTATLATQNVTTLATTYTLRFEGTGSITLSGTATGTYTAGAHSVVCTAGTLTSTVTGTVTNADLRPTNAGVNLPPYQRVGASTDYDTAGFPAYLKFDGIDDYLVTNNIDFTATDKMTVCAGVRKLSGAIQNVYELSAIYASNSGSFATFINSGGASTNTIDAGLKGSGASTYFLSSSYGTPISYVHSVSYNIAGTSRAEEIIPRINGVLNQSGGSGAVNTGGGNFGNYPLYIGRRGGTTLPFNGRLYSFVVCGKLASAAEITATEAYINQKTRAY